MALLPAACKQADTAPEATDAVTGSPEAPEGVSVTNARLVLPPVAGNPGAVYFDITNGSDSQLAIASAAVTGAGMAMLHASSTQGNTAEMVHLEEVPFAARQTVTFAPGGLHVMVHDLGPDIVAGSTAEVTLTFINGDKVSFPAAVETIGGGS
ncbi:copper chaperone PCu(A)C [Croceibacterium mercuriale]|uniref:copper chaperone PCu(A)C n=1 Tax=Croceibacterium mercuriale TaxID=1572751 RepID=UPI0013791E66|nr:copper chaperone PCu(A)C [Croceibacterium mercuriale]